MTDIIQINDPIVQAKREILTFLEQFEAAEHIEPVDLPDGWRDDSELSCVVWGIVKKIDHANIVTDLSGDTLIYFAYCPCCGEPMED